MGQWFERIPEKDQKIDLAIDNLGADLLITAQWSTLESRDFEAQFAFQDLAGGAGSIHFVVRQEIAVIFGPFYQIPFLIVVRNQGDLLVMFHGDSSVSHTTLSVLSPSSEMAQIACRTESTVVFHTIPKNCRFRGQAAQDSPSASAPGRHRLQGVVGDLLLVKQEALPDGHDRLLLGGDHTSTLCKFQAFGQQALAS
jgi:hypothetical protein